MKFYSGKNQKYIFNQLPSIIFFKELYIYSSKKGTLDWALKFYNYDFSFVDLKTLRIFVFNLIGLCKLSVYKLFFTNNFNLQRQCLDDFNSGYTDEMSIVFPIRSRYISYIFVNFIIITYFFFIRLDCKEPKIIE